MSGWDALRRAAIEHAAMAVLADREADEHTRREARAALERPEPECVPSRLSDCELDVLLDCMARARGEHTAPTHYIAPLMLAVSAQKYADARRAEALAAIEAYLEKHRGEIVTRPELPRCSRCFFADDTLMSELKEAVEEDAKILTPEIVGVLPGGDRGK